SGATRADLFARTGFDARRLEQPETRLEFEEFARLLSAAVDLSQDDALALHVAEHMSDSAVDLLAHLTAHAPTMREAIAVASQFGALVFDELPLGMRDEENVFVVRCAFPRLTPQWDRMIAEQMMGGLMRLARTFVGPSAIARRAYFEHDRPRHDREYTRIFGRDVRFGQDETSIAFDRELADRPQIHQHPELYSLLRTEAERRLDQLA